MESILKNLSDDLAAAVAAAAGSIVRIEARRRTPATGVIWSADGIIVTSHHVVERDEGIRIGLPDGSVTEASLIGRDPSTDLAVLRANTGGAAAAAWLGHESLKVGHLVLAVGRPGAQPQATLGIISAVDEGWRTPGGGMIDAFVQTDVVMYPGFSGGPLVGADGAFAGINTSALVRGISLTIPAATVRRVTETLLAHGRVRRGYLGVSAQPARLPANVAAQLGQETGLLLMSVEPDSPADAGGLTLGDTLVMLDGHPLRQMDDLMGLLSGDRVGTSAAFKIVRGGQIHDLSITIGERS